MPATEEQFKAAFTEVRTLAAQPTQEEQLDVSPELFSQRFLTVSIAARGDFSKKTVLMVDILLYSSTLSPRLRRRRISSRRRSACSTSRYVTILLSPPLHTFFLLVALHDLVSLLLRCWMPAICTQDGLGSVILDTLFLDSFKYRARR